MTVELQPVAVEPSSEKTFLFQDVGEGCHQCWYPVALSESVPKGQVVGQDLGDGRVVVYRGADGVARVVSAYCRHMGSDLSVGDVVGDELRCAFHHWHYGGDGRCTAIPSGDRIPRGARLFSFPVAEQWGIIWAFWGRDPLYPAPSFQGQREDEEFIWRSFEVPLAEPLLVKPWVFATNLFDWQHLHVLHNVPVDFTEVMQKEWAMGWSSAFPHPAVGEIQIENWVWGTNSVVSHGKRGAERTMHIAGISPMGREGTKIFVTVAAEQSESADDFLDQQQAMHTQLINEDLPVLNTIRFGRTQFVESDKHLTRFLRYVRKFPKVTMAELEASAKMM